VLKNSPPITSRRFSRNEISLPLSSRIIVALPARGGFEYYRRKWLSEFFNAIGASPSFPLAGTSDGSLIQKRPSMEMLFLRAIPRGKIRAVPKRSFRSAFQRYRVFPQP
jgi:hypothetical protein